MFYKYYFLSLELMSQVQRFRADFQSRLYYILPWNVSLVQSKTNWQSSRQCNGVWFHTSSLIHKRANHILFLKKISEFLPGFVMSPYYLFIYCLFFCLSRHINSIFLYPSTSSPVLVCYQVIAFYLSVEMLRRLQRQKMVAHCIWTLQCGLSVWTSNDKYIHCWKTFCMIVFLLEQ